MAATTDRRKRSLGIAAYFATATAVAVRIRPFAVRLVVDGVVHETDALVVLVANTGELVPGLLGPRLPLVPDDGLLDVLVARGRGPAGGSRAALELLLGRGVHAAIGPYAARFTARHVEVVVDPGEPIEVDGDVVGAGHLVADLVPGAVRILVPGLTRGAPAPTPACPSSARHGVRPHPAGPRRPPRYHRLPRPLERGAPHDDPDAPRQPAVHRSARSRCPPGRRPAGPPHRVRARPAGDRPEGVRGSPRAAPPDRDPRRHRDRGPGPRRAPGRLPRAAGAPSLPRRDGGPRPGAVRRRRRRLRRQRRSRLDGGPRRRRP